MSGFITPEDREIDGRVYRVNQFLGKECFLHYAALLKIIGEPLAKGLLLAIAQPSEAIISPIAHLKNSPLDKEAEEFVPAVAEAISTLTEKLNPKDMLILITAMLSKTKVIESGDKGDFERNINIDLDFGGGRMKPLFKLFMFVLEVNFADFLPSGTNLMTVVKDLAAEVAAK